MDVPTVRSLIAEAIAAEGLVPTWDDVVRPVLGAVADRWALTGAGVEIEHLLSESVIAVYGAHALAAPRPATDTRSVLLAGAPEEGHHLPLVVLGAVLADRGVPHRPLGARLPFDALVTAVRRTAPAAVVLWAQVPGTADPALFTALPRTRPGFRSFAAGPGWPAAVPGAEHLGSLGEALEVLTRITHMN
jgi:MerR family transcriptional regulator, light-induced transcriptional regulator